MYLFSLILLDQYGTCKIFFINKTKNKNKNKNK